MHEIEEKLEKLLIYGAYSLAVSLVVAHIMKNRTKAKMEAKHAAKMAAFPSNRFRSTKFRPVVPAVAGQGGTANNSVTLSAGFRL